MFENKLNQSANQQQNNQNQQTIPATQSAQGLFSLPPAVMSMLPWIPFALEAMTGQKIPQMTGTMAEIQQGIAQIQMAQVQIIQKQTQLEQRLTSLESNATNQFTSLAQQVQSVKSIRLSHSKETKEIDYNLDPNQQN